MIRISSGSREFGKGLRLPVTLSLLLVCLAASALPAQTEPVSGRSSRQNISGHVRDAESGEALPYANVIVVGTNFGAATNQNGYFVIVYAPADTCTLRVLYVGYAAREIRYDNRRPSREPLEIRISRQTIELEGIQVETEAPPMLEVSDEPGQVALSPAEISILPNMGEVDVFRSFQLLPGISGVSDGSAGMYVRGGTPDQNLILYDGMTIYHVDHFFGLFSAFNADAVKDIRVYKGGFPAEFGGRTSSVVNLTGKTGDANNLRYGAGINLLSGSGVVEVPLSKVGSFLFSARRSYTDVVQSGLYNKLFDFVSGENAISAANPNIFTGTEKPNFYFYDTNAKLTLTPGALDIFTLSLYSGRDNLAQHQSLSGEEFNYRGEEVLLEDSAARLVTDKSTRWGNQGASAKWSRKLHDRFYSNLLVSYSRYFSKYELDRDFSSSSASDSLTYFRTTNSGALEDNELTEIAVHLDNEIHLSNSHDLKIGLGYSDFDLHYYSTYNDTLPVIWSKSGSGLGSVYFQDLWKLFPWLEITGGLRGSYYKLSGESYLEPRVSAVWSPLAWFKVKGAWGQYDQFVNRVTNEDVLEGSRDFWFLADSLIRPGYAEHWIAGASLENDEYLLDLEGYYKNLEGVVEYSRRASYNRDIFDRTTAGEIAPGTGFFTGTGFATGLDVLAQKKRGRLTGWIGYSLGRVRYEIPGINNGFKYPASHDRTHEVNLVGKLSLKQWDISLTWVYASGKAYTAPESQYYLNLLDGSRKSYIHVSGKNSLRLPAYQRMDFSISRSFETANTRYVVGLSIFNLYNHKNFWYRQYNLDTVPVALTDVQMLSFTPTVYFKIYSR
ncbi:MAG: TonB-dependent receptor [Candidatus Glassbacteria bacterium]